MKTELELRYETDPNLVIRDAIVAGDDAALDFLRREHALRVFMDQWQDSNLQCRLWLCGIELGVHSPGFRRIVDTFGYEAVRDSDGRTLVHARTKDLFPLRCPTLLPDSAFDLRDNRGWTPIHAGLMQGCLYLLGRRLTPAMLAVQTADGQTVVEMARRHWRLNEVPSRLLNPIQRGMSRLHRLDRKQRFEALNRYRSKGVQP